MDGSTAAAAQSNPFAALPDPYSSPAPAASPAAAASPAEAPGNPFMALPDPYAAAPVTPPSNPAQPHVVGRGGFARTAAPMTPNQQVESDVPGLVASAGVGFGKTAVGMMQLLAANNAAPAPRAAPLPIGQFDRPEGSAPVSTPADPSIPTTPQGEAAHAAVPGHLLDVQQALSNVQQNIEGGYTAPTKAAAAAGWNPKDPNSVFDHPLVQTALAKGVGPAADLLMTIAPAGLLGEAMNVLRGGQAAATAGKLALAGTMGVQGAGSVMSAVSDTVNNKSDTDLKKLVPAYAAARQTGLSVPAAKAKLVNQLGDTQALWSGMASAALGDVGGDVGGEALFGAPAIAGSLARRVGVGATAAGAANAALGAQGDIAQQLATQPLTKQPLNWHEVAKQSIISGLQGVGFGAVAGAAARHAPETLAAGTAEHLATPEAAAVNAATHPDMSTTPGAPEPEPPPVDYDAVHGEDDEDKPEAVSPEGKPPAPGAPPALDTAPVPAARALEPTQEPVAPAGRPPVEPAPVPGADAGVPGVSAVEPARDGPKPFTMPADEQAAVPVAKPTQVAAAARGVQGIAKGIVARIPGASTDTGLVSTIMGDLMKQAHDELPYFEGSPTEMARQFMAAKPMRDRIAEAVVAAKQSRAAALEQPDAVNEAYGPEATDAAAQPQGRARAGELYEPGNEAALAAKINPDEDNRTTYTRAENMVAKRGDEAHPVYHEILGMRGQRGGDVRGRERAMTQARQAEQDYLQAESVRHEDMVPPAEHEGMVPPAEHELLQREPPDGAENPAAFWARVERAHQHGVDNGSFIKRGSFLYRARKALDDARDERGAGAVPNRATTERFKGDEFLARTNNPELAATKDIDPLGHGSLDEYDDQGSDNEQYMKRGEDGAPAKETLTDRAKAVREGAPVKRGAGTIMNRLRMEKSLGETAVRRGRADQNKQVAAAIDHGELRDVEDFMHMLGPALTKDTGFSVKSDPNGPLGSFNPRNRIITLYRKAMDRGELTRTMIHELWHSVETALPLKDKFAIRKEHVQQFKKYMGKNPWLESFAWKGADPKDNLWGLKDSLEGKAAQDFIDKYSNNTKVMHNVRVGKSSGGTRPAVHWLPTNENYRFKNWNEYFAETLTDKHFKETDLQDHRARSIIGHVRTFVQTIKNRIARMFGGNTSGRVYEGFQQQQYSHRQEALDAYGAEQFMKATGNKPGDATSITDPSWGDKMASSISDAFKANNAVMHGTRSGLLSVASGQDIARAGEKLFDWTPKTRLATESTESPSHTFQNAMSHMSERARTLVDAHTPLMRRVAAYLNKSGPDEAARFAEAQAHSTRFDYDPTIAPNPKSPPKSARGIQRLARHQEGYAAFKALSPEGRVLFKDTRDAIRQTREDAVRQLTRNNIEQVHINNAREEHEAGKTPAPLDHAEIDAQTQRYMDHKETEADKLELGATHDFLTKQRRILSSSDNYFPERRYGKHALVYRDTRPEEHTFPTEAAMQDFAKSTDLYINGSGSKDFDANGDEVDKDDPAAQPVVRSEHTVRTQNNGLEFFDSVKGAEKRRQELLNHPTNKYQVSNVEHTKDSMAVKKTLSPGMLETLRSALNKTAHSDEQKEAYRQALNEAVIRLLPPNSMRSGALRRHNYMGASRDTMKTLSDHFSSAANIQSKLEYAREADNAIEAMKEHTDKQRFNNDPDSSRFNHIRQELTAAVEKRRQGSPLDEPTSAKVPAIIRTAQQIAFVKFMATPSFNMIQAAQPWMTGHPYLAARYGRRASAMEMGRVLGRIGGKSILGEGVAQVHSAMKNAITTDLRTPGDYASIVKANMLRNARTPEEKVQAKSEGAVLQRLIDDGIVDHGAGLQVRQVLNSAQRNPVLRGLAAAEEAARAMPTAVEVLNRSMLGIAAHRLELAKSGDPEKAYVAARTAIKETQGDYSPANTPLLMQGNRHPYLAPAFTFRKYAQMIYSLIGNHAYQALAGESKEVRQVARRTIGNTLMMHAMVAGMHGLPVGSAVMAAAIVSLALGEDKPWDYDEWAHQTLSHFMGPKTADAIINGLPTLAGVNVVKRMGLDSLLFDQLPKDNKISSWMSLAGDTLMGAPGEVATFIPQALQDIRHGNYIGAMGQVLPKVITDPIKAIGLAEHGLRDSEGNTIVDHLPPNQLLAQAMGFEPDAVEEAYGARDVGIGAKKDYQEDRAAAMQGFIRSYKAGNFAGASKALEQFNVTVPAASRINFSTALKAMNSGTRGTTQVDGLGFTKKQKFLAAPMAGYNVPN